MGDSVGSLLASIAVLLSDGLRILDLADKRHWGQDEFEQKRALDEALDEARKDFQELTPLVHGQVHYELDRRHDSLQELRKLRSRFRDLVSALKDWTRSGGPIDAVWVLDTHALQKDLHRAQCRAARRIFTSDRESSSRCLGAYLVGRAKDASAACHVVGGFERFGDVDVVFVCDFCDGHLLWLDVEAVPLPALTSPTAAARTSSTTTTSSMTTTSSTSTNTTSQTTTTVNPPPPSQTWQLPAYSASTSTPKHVVSPLVAIANHVAPAHGDWLAPLLCPYCEQEARRPHDDDDDDEADAFRSVDVDEFDDLAALQDHLDAYHAGPATSSDAACVVM
ncbi:hypothetical protein XA68_17699 [Ophiocordyceps unilateralis]|uniref:Uncharacterized protein n=1 Tax=Ophiocordyceps unilateralis TaxID=268505 RepID=A0A2A9P4F5_OPHUN|nr:hypothetical protein XA68_17699 [Ophiocordyceps unilateralis]